MWLGLTALVSALAVGLLAPGALAVLNTWAGTLRESRRAVIEQELPEDFLFIDSRRFGHLLVALVVTAAAAGTILAGSGVVGSVAGALALLLPAVGARWWRRRRHR